MRKLIFSLILISQGILAQKKYEANWQSIDSRPIPVWFEDAKFGIFIHWGLFSVPAWGPLPRDGAGIYDCYAEWYWNRLLDKNSKVQPLFDKFHTQKYGKDFKYQDFVKDFKAEMFNPDDWADVFKNSGAKYVVLTSKHHEGFTLWESPQAWNWNAVDIGPHRDLAGDLMQSVRKKGLRMGYYYSLYEWFNPLYKSDVNRYVDAHMIPQMKDLVTKYKPDILWTDGEWDQTAETWKSTQFLAWLYNESVSKDEIVINDRWGKDTRSRHGGIYTTEYELVHEGNGDGKKLEKPWEECRGIGNSFGYNRNENLNDYTSSEQLIHILIDKVARGGNLLLNIGPTADGRIPVIMQQRLADMGNWLKINGEGVYNTRAWDKAPTPKADTKQYYTRKGNDLYVILTRFPQEKILVEGLKVGGKVSLLGFKETIKTSFAGGKMTITVPNLTPTTNPSSYAWVFKIEKVL
jgi:alpha-L-fucosidase